MRRRRPVSTPFKRLARQSAIYALGNVAAKLSGLLLAPLYLNEIYLTQVAFGYLVTLEATAALAIPLIGLGLTSGLLKFLADPDMEAHHDAVPFTTLVISVAVALAMVALMWFAAPAAAELLFGTGGSAFLIRLLAVYVALKAVGGVPFMLLRANERAGWYVAAASAETLIMIGGAYYALAVLGLGLEGVLWAYVLSSGASTLLLTVGMVARVRWKVDAALLARLVRFGAPLALAGIALPFLHVGDRYLLEWLADTREVAVYGWAARISGVLNMFLVQSFQLAFAVVGLKTLGSEPAGAALHRRTFRHFGIWSCWLALGLSLFAFDATALLSDNPDYLRAAMQVFPLSLGFVFYGLYAVTVNVVYASGATGTVAAGVFGAAVFNGLLNLVLIPPFGGMGAAVATLAAYALLAFMAERAAVRQQAVVFPWRSLGIALGLTLLLWLAALPSQTWSMGARLSFRSALMLSYPVLTWAVGLYSPDEVALARSWLQRQWRTRRPW